MTAAARRLVLVIVLTWPLSCAAGKVIRAEVHHKAGRYTLVLAADLDADRAAVYAIVTDYDRLELISRTLVEASRLPSEDPSRERRRLVTNTCILLYCKKAALVEDVERNGTDTIYATIVPELSDFRSGWTEWRLSEQGDGRSRIDLHAEMEPDFWVPPLIGPWLIKQKMLNEARDTVEQIEKLAKAN